MVHQKLLLASGVLLLLTTACGSLPTADFTETVSALIPTTAQPSTLFELTVTDTVTSVTSTTLIDTPSATHTESSLLISVVLPEIVGEHRVAEGETLSCIGRAYGVLPKAIADANGIEVTAVLSAGQVLKIPRVSWTNIPYGVTCRPQFSPPFPTDSVPNSTALPQTLLPNWTLTSTEDLAPTETPSSPTLADPPTNTPTDQPVPATATPISPTVNIPPPDTETIVPSPIPTIYVPPPDSPTPNPSPAPVTPIAITP